MLGSLTNEQSGLLKSFLVYKAMASFPHTERVIVIKKNSALAIFKSIQLSKVVYS